jgi:Spy/CpxP family protein refolding chaperone
MPDPQTPASAAPPPRSRRRWFKYGIAAAIGGVVASAATFGFSQRGWHGHRGAWNAASLDPAQLNARIEKGVDYLLRRVSASDEQKRKVTALAQAAAADLRPLRDQWRQGREELRAVVSASTIDRARLEVLRAKQVSLADAASKRATQALADIADVLTPDQRIKMVQLWDRYGRRRG